MAEISNVPAHILDQVTGIPHITEVANPYIGAAAAGITAVAAYFQIKNFQVADDQFAARHQNPQLLEDSIVKVRGVDIEGSGGRTLASRLAPALGFTVGAGLAVAGLFSGISYEGKSEDKDTQAVAVLGSSYAMREARDLGSDISRFAASINALDDSGYGGQLAIVESGRGSSTRVEMGPSWRDRLDDVAEPDTDPNGDNLAEATGDAISLLPLQRSKNGELKRAGTVVVLSDGVIESKPVEMSELAARAKESGAKVRIIVPGTANGTYEDAAGKTIKAGANQAVFNDFEGEQVVAANSEARVDAAVQDVLDDLATTREKRDWKGLLYLGIASIAVSGMTMSKRAIRKA